MECVCEQGVIQDFEVEGGNVAKKRSTVSILCYCKIQCQLWTLSHTTSSNFRGGISPPPPPPGTV